MKVVYPLANATVSANGVPVVIHVGEHWRADDPVVKANPGLFTDDPFIGVRSTLPVEQATAAPGERRQYVRRS